MQESQSRRTRFKSLHSWRLLNARIGQFGPIEERSAKAYPEYRELGQAGPSEARLIGARNLFPYVGGADWICVDEKHWLFAGTGMKNGDGIPGLVGWEWIGAPADLPGLRVVAQGNIACAADHRQFVRPLSWQGVSLWATTTFAR